MSALCQLNASVGKMRSHVNKAVNIYDNFISDDRTSVCATKLSKPNKDVVVSKLKSLIEVTCALKHALAEHEKLISNLELEEKLTNKVFDLQVKLTEKVLEKVSSKFIEATKNELNEIMPKPKNDPPMFKKVMTANDQTLILGINENDIASSHNTNKKSFSTALKENLNDKLKNIPVANSTVNKQGKAVLTFPTAEICLKAKNTLQTDFNVSVSDKKPPIIQPRLKINHLAHELSSLEKDELRTKIMSKNEVLKNATESEFNITFIEKNLHYAVAKVSPEIFQTLKRNGRIYIDLRSFQVTEHFHVVQCYKCQSYGHNSQSCNAENVTCLYCGRNHRSNLCQNKKNKDAHNCANCKNGLNPKIKSKSNTHSSTSKSCPIYIREIEKLKENTCYDQNTYLNAKNQ